MRTPLGTAEDVATRVLRAMVDVCADGLGLVHVDGRLTELNDAGRG
ncbi:MAG: hypothetical protein JWP46_2331, partial [Modestobacter sp.]|nr:hypothetical protein [Modestobacter sp.]